jgi:hypothetical protein
LPFKRATPDWRLCTRTLIGLSTAARKHCAVHLTPPDGYLSSVQSEDYDEAVVGQLISSIPPANDHHAWIELLAKVMAATRAAVLPDCRNVNSNAATFAGRLCEDQRALARSTRDTIGGPRQRIPWCLIVAFMARLTLYTSGRTADICDLRGMSDSSKHSCRLFATSLLPPPPN